MTSFRIFLLFAMFVCGHTLELRAQDPVAIHYTVEDGLPSNEVYDAYQDKDDNMWFATDHGISRFDGYEFVNFSTEDGLSHNTVFEFKEDSHGIVWMRCYDGSLSYMKDGIIRPYPHNDKLLAQLGGGYFANFDFDEHNRMYFSASNGPRATRVLDIVTGIVDSLKLPEDAHGALIRTSDSLHLISAISIPNKDIPELATMGQVHCNDSMKYWTLPLPAPSNYHWGRNIFISLNANTVVGIIGTVIFRIQDCVITKYRMLELGSNGIYRDMGDNVWMFSNSGVSVLDDNLQSSGLILKDQQILGMIQDHYGQYWFCTFNGVFRIRNLNSKSYQKVEGEPLEEARRLRILDSVIYALHDKSAIVSARIRQSNSALQFQRLVQEGRRHRHDFLPYKKDSEVLIIFSQFESSFYAIAPRFKTSMHLTWPIQIRLQDTKILMASDGGWSVIRLDSNISTFWTYYRGPNIACTSILEDQHRNIWVGTSKGLYVHENDSFHPYQHNQHCFRERVTDFALLENGGVVVATRGSGLILIEGNRHFQFTTKNGLPSNMCDRLYLGASGLWICTNRGLSLIPRAKHGSAAGFTGPPINLSILDGLLSNKVNDVLEFGDMVYVATDKGLATLRTSDIAKDTIFLKTKIVSAMAETCNLQNGEIPATEQDDLKFRFRANKLPAVGAVRYSYMLEGYDSDWRTTSEETAEYFDLPPGQYKFRVYAGYPYVKQDSISEISISLPYKLIERRWFQILLGLLGILFCFLIIRQFYLGRSRRLQAHTYRLQADIKALRSQMRPHFIFNALNSIYDLILRNDNAAAEVYLPQFAKLMRNVLDASHHETIPISQEISILQVYLELEKLRFGKDFTFIMEVQEQIDWDLCNIPPMLLQPIVENAIWHGLRMQKNNPTLWLRFLRSEAGIVTCEIEDNGIGRQAASQKPKTHSSTSIGITNIEERITLLNAIKTNSITMEIVDRESESGEPMGTLVRIQLNFT
ncbi:MAG: histidine kinase [Bacteroidia bacterium]|nr:histidine kinase [Bacteroidia bacterium]